MREYKFRGKPFEDIDFDEINVHISKGDFVYGNLIIDGKVAYIVNGIVEATEEYLQLEQWIPVRPETVGQFTGLKDKNGLEIYEGDMVIHTSFPRDTQEVRFKDGCFVANQMALYSYHHNVIEIIGNIHNKGEVK